MIEKAEQLREELETNMYRENKTRKEQEKQ